MSLYRKFASIAHPEKYAYAYDSSVYDYKSVVFDRFRQFETYGDGLTQHSGDWSVQIEFLADYLMSLAAVMVEDGELATEAGYRLNDKPRREFIEFAATVVWKESDDQYDKRRYFSSKLLKIGGRKFEHDKRFEQIEKWCDGSPGSILRIVTSQYANGLERYLYADAVREWCLEDSKGRPWMPLTGQFLNWFDDHHKAYDLKRAFEAAQAISESWRLRASAQGYIEEAQRKATPKPEPVANDHAPSETPFPICDICGNQHHINDECTKVVA